jgi:hypothetical protein
MPEYLTGTSDTDSNVHHWAWSFALGYEFGHAAIALNMGREAWQFRGDVLNSGSDVLLGTAGATMGVALKVLGAQYFRSMWQACLGWWPR